MSLGIPEPLGDQWLLRLGRGEGVALLMAAPVTSHSVGKQGVSADAGRTGPRAEDPLIPLQFSLAFLSLLPLVPRIWQLP